MKVRNLRCREKRKNLLERLQVRESADEIPSESGYETQSESLIASDAEHNAHLIVSLPAIRRSYALELWKKHTSR